MTIRLTGLASGLDTDTVIKQMLATRQTKIDKVKGEKQILEWKQQLYKDIVKDIKNFQFKYLYSASDNSVLKTNFFLSTKATISNDKGLLGVTTTKDAIQGRYEVKIDKMAKGASVSGKLTDKNVKDAKDKLSIKTGDMKEAVEIDMTEVNTVKELVNKINTNSDLNNKVKASYSEITGEFKIETVATGGNQTLKIDGTIEGLSGTSIKEAKGKFDLIHSISAIIKSEDSNLVDLGIEENSTIKIGSDEFKVGPESKISDLVNFIDGKEGLNAKFENNKLTITKEEKGSDTSVGNGFSIEGTGNIFEKLGFGDVQKVDSKVSVDSSTYTMDNVKLNDYGKIIINGIEAEMKIEINYLSTEGNLIGKLIDSKTGKEIEGITVESSGTDTDGKTLYTLTSKGYAFHVDSNNNTDKNTTTMYRGQDSEVKIKTQGSNSESVIRNANNKFTLDGIVFDIKAADPNETIVFNVESNTDKAVENIKNFINDYNKLIDNIAAKIYEKKQYTYKPLTDEEKEEMKDEEIKKWEEKAKQGLIRGDSDLENMLFSMRNSFFDKVEGANLSLFDIGITTSKDYTQRGKLVFDSEGEEKLIEALKNNPDDVYNLFNKKSSDGKSDGIFRKLESIVNEANKVISEKAGVGRFDKADEIKDTIIKTDLMREKDKTINDLISKMEDEENRLYKQFANLETMMNYYNSQSSWLTQQLGGM